MLRRPAVLESNQPFFICISYEFSLTSQTELREQSAFIRGNSFPTEVKRYRNLFCTHPFAKTGEYLNLSG